MAAVYFRSLDEAEVIDVEFLKPQGGVRLFKLLVDSGFTGKSSVVLGQEASELVRAQVPPAQVSGALQGAQDRGWVTCRIPELNSQCTIIAIITDTSVLFRKTQFVHLPGQLQRPARGQDLIPSRIIHLDPFAESLLAGFFF